jgi:lysophospholipase L1-like esterase
MKHNNCIVTKDGNYRHGHHLLKISALIILNLLLTAMSARAESEKKEIKVSLSDITWGSSSSFSIDNNSGEITPDGDRTVIITAKKDIVVDSISGSIDFRSVYIGDRDTDPNNVFVSEASFWFKPLDITNGDIFFMGKTMHSDWCTKTWQKDPIRWQQINEKPFSKKLVMTWDLRTIPAGTRFLIGGIKMSLFTDQYMWRPANDSLFETDGLPFQKLNKGLYYRLPADVIKNIPDVSSARSPIGGRIRFRTNSRNILIRVNSGSGFASGVAAWDGIELYEGSPHESVFKTIILLQSTPGKQLPRGTFIYMIKSYSSPDTREFTVYLPAGTVSYKLEIGLDANAAIEKPTPFYPFRPVVFYGTSFVMSGASRTSMLFPAILGRELGIDFINLGLSGNGRCEPDVAKALAGIDASCFVMGPILNNKEIMYERYPEFVKTLRERNPQTPILLMTRFKTVGITENYQVNKLVYETFKMMKDKGDENIYFFDAYPLYEDGMYIDEFSHPTIDGTHASDLGHKMIADELFSKLREILF